MTSGTRARHGRPARSDDAGPVRQRIDEPRHAAVDGRPVARSGRRSPAACAIAGRCRIRFVESAERRVDDHRVVHRGVGQDVAHRDAARSRPSTRARSGAPCRARSDGRTAPAPSARATSPALRRRPARSPPSRGTGSRHPGDAHARQPRSAASSSVISPWTNRTPIVWTRAGILSLLRQQRDAAGNENARQFVAGGQRHHHRRQSLVARRHAQHAAPRRQRSDETAEDHRGVVAEGKAVEHRRSSPATARRTGRCTPPRTESLRPA